MFSPEFKDSLFKLDSIGQIISDLTKISTIKMRLNEQ